MRHLVAHLDDGRPVGRLHPLLVLSDLGHLLQDVEAALFGAHRRLGDARAHLRQVEGALAKPLLELLLGAALGIELRAVVERTALQVGERVKGLLDGLPHLHVAAAVGVVLHRLLLVRSPDVIRGRGLLHAKHGI